MRQWEDIGLEKFLSSHPGMRLAEYGDQLVIKGIYRLNAQMDGFHRIEQAFELKIIIPKQFPKDVPVVTEEGKAFPRSSDFHTYQDGSLCLGSEIKLKSVLLNDPNIQGFVENILDPFLYSIAYKIEYDEFPNGDLAHGEAGLIDDYEQMFEVSGKKSVIRALNALCKRKREANKLPCPCDCGNRLGVCDYRFKLARWRGVARRRWFRAHLSNSFTPIEKPRKKKSKASKKAKRD